MKIIKHFNDILFGELVTLMITGDSVTICQGKNSVKYEFPKTFQDYNYLNHTEEMAGWLLAILQEEKIRIRRCDCAGFWAGLSADCQASCYDSAGTTELGSLGRKSVCSF